MVCTNIKKNMNQVYNMLRLPLNHLTLHYRQQDKVFFGSGLVPDPVPGLI